MSTTDTQLTSDRWVYSKRQEDGYSGDCGSMEEAVREGLDEFGTDAIWVGLATPPTQPEQIFDASDWLETVSCQDDYSGDYAEDWDSSTEQQRDELTKEVRAVMAAWLERHKLRPTHFIVATPVCALRDSPLEDNTND